jgi:hypothetical protein
MLYTRSAIAILSGASSWLLLVATHVDAGDIISTVGIFKALDAPVL